jgi:hypothetical protein
VRQLLRQLATHVVGAAVGTESPHAIQEHNTNGGNQFEPRGVPHQHPEARWWAGGHHNTHRSSSWMSIPEKLWGNDSGCKKLLSSFKSWTKAQAQLTVLSVHPTAHTVVPSNLQPTACKVLEDVTTQTPTTHPEVQKVAEGRRQTGQLVVA